MEVVTPEDPAPSRHQRVFIGVWAVAVAYALLHLDRGWFAVDAGTLGQAAQRVLDGQLPHRDFVDVYTGGLAFLNAAGFKVFGVSVMGMRWVVFAAFVAWVPAVWAIASRSAPPPLAAMATLLAAAWTLPVYAEGMPSWYNLFLATFGVWALLCYVDRPGVGWLVAAGVFGGLSLLIKIVALYYFAGVFLFFVWLEASRGGAGGVAREGGQEVQGVRDQGVRDRGYRTLALTGCVVLGAMVSQLVWRAMGPGFFFLYAAPPLAAIAALASVLLRPSGARSGERLRAYLRMLAPFLAGAALPVVVFLIPYALSGAVGDLLRGVLELPQRRLDSVGMIGPVDGWVTAVPAAVIVAFLARPLSLAGRAGRALGVAVGAILLIAVAFGHRDGAYTVIFRTLLWLPPLASVVAGVVVARRGAAGGPEAPALLATFGLISLVQVPFAAPAYFFYAAPILVLLAAALMGGSPLRRPWLVGLFVAMLAFTVLRLNVGFSPDLGFRYRPAASEAPLALQRAMGIRVTGEDKTDYEAVVELVTSLAPGDFLYAGPDAPEVYFLTGLRNPTPTLYEFLDEDEGRNERLLQSLEDAGVRVIVVRPVPQFSGPLDNDLMAELGRRFPLGRQIGRFFVAWKR
jgi:hypothetical protein